MSQQERTQNCLVDHGNNPCNCFNAPIFYQCSSCATHQQELSAARGIIKEFAEGAGLVIEFIDSTSIAWAIANKEKLQPIVRSLKPLIAKASEFLKADAAGGEG